MEDGSPSISQPRAQVVEQRLRMLNVLNDHIGRDERHAAVSERQPFGRRQYSVTQPGMTSECGLIRIEPDDRPAMCVVQPAVVVCGQPGRETIMPAPDG